MFVVLLFLRFCSLLYRKYFIIVLYIVFYVERGWLCLRNILFVIIVYNVRNFDLKLRDFIVF